MPEASLISRSVWFGESLEIACFTNKRVRGLTVCGHAVASERRALNAR
jgi:hypothetical protein